MDPVTLSAILGGLSTAGDLWGQHVTEQSADKQMAFQERMSSTAAQRAVKDYTAAGLNPALAYDRPASSPGGAGVNIGNPLATGISNALATRKLAQDMQIAKQQSDADLQVKQQQMGALAASNAQANTQAQLNVDNSNLARQTLNYNLIAQPQTQRLQQLQETLQKLGIPKAETEAEANKFYTGKSAISNAQDAVKFMKLMMGRLLK